MTSTRPAKSLTKLRDYGKYMSLSRTSLINGSNYTVHPLPEGVDKLEYLEAIKLWHVEQGHIISDVLSYYNSDRDPLTCPYHLLNVPGPNAEWGWEIKWH